jgi:hypothetical protein
VDAIEALRSSARRYVLDRWDHWVAIYNRLPDHANRLAPNPNSHAPFYTDEQLGVFPRYQLLRQFDVDLQEVSLEGIESLNAARDALAATAESSLAHGTGAHLRRNPSKSDGRGI